MMLRKLALLLIGCISVNYGFSQGTPAPRVPEQEYFYWQLDSLAANYHFKPSSKDLDTVHLNRNHFASEDLPAWPDEIYAERLRNLGSPIPLDFNYSVKAFINLYVNDRREVVSRMLGLRFIYFPIFEEVFEREGLPQEFKYLAVVESALNTHAVSRAGATGMWQFMYATGQMYKLKIDSWVDERRDPIKATEAAAKYFKNMYAIYKDWLLVIAAYNCGPGNVNKAIRASGGKTNFWDISPYLPVETRGYVPAFIAANYVFNYASDHNLYPVPIDFSFQVDTVHITRQKITLQQIADITHTDFYALKDLNPELKSNTIPYSTNPYVLRVPHSVAIQFVTQRDSIYNLIASINPDSIAKKYITEKISPISRQPYNTVNAPEGATFGNNVLVYHTVRRGDVAGQIAARYNVNVKDLAAWNNLRGYAIYPGQKLKVYVNGKAPKEEPPKQETQTAATATQNTPAMQTASQTQTQQNSQTQQKPEPPKASASSIVQNVNTIKTAAAPAPEPAKLYRVQAGDTMWDIAKRFDGLTVERIKELNNLTDNRLTPGQVLKLN